MSVLSVEFARLNPEQQRAVLCERNTVVLAGPGSGKTDTLVMKVAHLLSEHVAPPRGLACITFNNDAVREFQQRLLRLGIRRSRRLFLGTVHSFGLNCILRPFGPFFMARFAKGLKVATPSHARELLEQCISQYIPEVGSWYAPTIQRYRRRLACHEDVSGYDDRDSQVLKAYLEQLQTEGLVDFEEIISLALTLVEEQPAVCDFLGARYPWLLVDEYQNLGGPLHQIVIHLVERAGIKAFAVGDPDQTVYEFTGADPMYLTALAAREDFEAIRLHLNYRSGRRLIIASQVALAPSEPRDYEPDPKREDLGEVYFSEVDGGYERQAESIVRDILPLLDNEGIEREEVAIIYRTKGKLFDAIIHELNIYGTPYLAERDGRYPRSPFVRWLQRCAAWTISGPPPMDVTFDDLLEYYVYLRRSAGLDHLDEGSLESRNILYSGLDSLRNSNHLLAEWLRLFNHRLEIHRLLSDADGHSDSIDDLNEILRQTEPQGKIATYSVGDFSGDGRVAGKVTLTTFHSCQGHQFKAVIIPGLQESVIPYLDWNRARRRYVEPSLDRMREERRLFYVGFTRARMFVFLVFSQSFINNRGFRVDLGPSRFVTEIRKRLSEL